MSNNILILLYPIKRSELNRFVPMALLIFCILFNYSLIYSLKDSYIISGLGAEAASFIELYIVLPVVFLFTFIYLKLSSIITSKTKLFYITCSFILSFFLLFTFILYPNLELIEPNPASIKHLTDKLPHLKWFFVIYQNWPLALFNVFSDLWVGMVLSLLFWQYANNVTPTEQAKRFYPLFIFIGNFALILSGVILKYICVNSSIIKFAENITILIIVIGLISMLLFNHITSIFEGEKQISFKMELPKKQLTFRESLSLIFGSKYLWLLAMIVISYGIIISVSQGLWRSEAVKLYPSRYEYTIFMADFQKWIGITSVITMLIGSIVIRKFSWYISAIITPVLTLITGCFFFLSVFFHEIITNTISQQYFLVFAVVIGTIHIVFTRSLKFALVDTTKELAYIPLEVNLKEKGRAAVELLGERIGKSGGHLLQTIIFIAIPRTTYEGVISVLFLVFIVAVLSWLFAVRMLNKEYSTILKAEISS